MENRESCEQALTPCENAETQKSDMPQEELHREALEALFRVGRAAKRNMTQLLGNEPRGDFMLLWKLEQLEQGAAGKPVSVSALVRASRQPAPAVSRTLRALEQKGYAARRTDPGDRRKTFVTLTEQGRAVLAELTERWKRQADLVMETLGEPRILELIALSRTLEQVLDSTGGGTKEKVRAK